MKKDVILRLTKNFEEALQTEKGIELLPDPLIIGCLNTDYGIQVATLTFLSLGADMHASLQGPSDRSDLLFRKAKTGAP